ncbi:MAG: HIT family protein [Alphaproteobacteria bacterium]|nr:HIT family protein [Alphaproteobacteria bacterium]MBU2380403.1 HIT family protein [Alphaproteobacteria bacterium]
MTNPTAAAFGYPQTLVAETRHWLVLVRPKQPTLGSLVLVCKEPVQAFPDLSPDAFSDLKAATRGIEAMLSSAVAYERINYLMLMMVDRDVHFHVIARYDGERSDAGLTFVDAGWPGPPDLKSCVDLDPEQAARLAKRLGELWRDVGGAAARP